MSGAMLGLGQREIAMKNAQYAVGNGIVAQKSHAARSMAFLALKDGFIRDLLQEICTRQIKGEGNSR